MNFAWTIQELNAQPEAKRKTKSFGIPIDAGRRVALAAEHLEHLRGGTTLVWFNDWAVWPSGQRMHIFERFLSPYGESRPLIEAPAFLFAEAEDEDLVSFVTLGILFSWDVHVINTKARHLLFYSHDEIGGVDEFFYQLIRNVERLRCETNSNAPPCPSWGMNLVLRLRFYEAKDCLEDTSQFTGHILACFLFTTAWYIPLRSIRDHSCEKVKARLD